MTPIETLRRWLHELRQVPARVKESENHIGPLPDDRFTIYDNEIVLLRRGMVLGTSTAAGNEFTASSFHATYGNPHVGPVRWQ